MIVKCLLTDKSGNILDNLTSLKWAWFDATSPLNFIAPTDTGSVGTTDTNAIIQVTISNSLLSIGQEGVLAIMDSTNTDMGMYKLRLQK